MNPYLWLTLAIIAEIIATSALKTSHNFTRLIPSIVVILGYGSAFYALSQTLRSVPLGIAYAIWSGVGCAAIAIIGYLLYQQPLSPTAIIGIALIIAGVVLIQLSGAH